MIDLKKTLDDYIYVVAQARYYSISLKKLFTLRDITHNVRALTGNDRLRDEDIASAISRGEIKVYTDFCFGEDEEGKYNLFSKSKILSPNMEDPNFHENIITLFEDVTNGNKTDMEYLLKWIAWKYLHPLSPMSSALVLKGAQGSGKGHIGTLLQTIFSKEYVRLNVSPENFSSHFSSIDGHTLICELSEQGEENYKVNASIAIKLKTLIMQNTFHLEKKYKDTEDVDNHTSFIITSNKQVPVLFDAKETGNRRFSVFQGDSYYNDEKGATIYSTVTNKEEVAKFLGYILNEYGAELGKCPVFSAHKNEVKDILEESAGTELQLFWNFLRETYMGELLSHNNLKSLFINFCKEREFPYEKLGKRLLIECPWREVRPNNEQGEQGERHRLVQGLGISSKTEFSPLRKLSEGVNINTTKRVVPRNIEEIF